MDHTTPLQRQIKRVTHELRARFPRDWNSYEIEDALENALNDSLGGRPWTHVEPLGLWQRLKDDAYPTIQGAEAAVAVYLAQPGRSADIDRFLVDMLLASELFAYAWRRRAFRWDGLINIAFIAAIGYGIAAWLGAEIWYVLATILVAWTVAAQARDGLKARSLLAEMFSSYQVLNGRVVSVRHLRSCVNKSTYAGVVWPATLNALLDDIEARTQRF